MKTIHEFAKRNASPNRRLLFLIPVLAVWMSMICHAAGKPDDAGGDRYVYLRTAYVEELKGSELPLEGNRLVARFLQFEGDFALFSHPTRKGMIVYIPKNQILFIVAPAVRY